MRIYFRFYPPEPRKHRGYTGTAFLDLLPGIFPHHIITFICMDTIPGSAHLPIGYQYRDHPALFFQADGKTVQTIALPAGKWLIFNSGLVSLKQYPIFNRNQVFLARLNKHAILTDDLRD